MRNAVSGRGSCCRGLESLPTDLTRILTRPKVKWGGKRSWVLSKLPFAFGHIRVQRFGSVNRWTINNDLCFHIYVGMLHLAAHVSSSRKLTSWCQYNIWQLTHSPWRNSRHGSNIQMQCAKVHDVQTHWLSSHFLRNLTPKCAKKREGFGTQPKQIVGCCSENTDSNYWNIFFAYK